MKKKFDFNNLLFISIIFLVVLSISIVAKRNEAASTEEKTQIKLESIKIIKRSIGQKLRAIFRFFRSTRCPSRNLLLRYDKSTRQCYESGSKGPCGRNMIFYAENNEFGVCDCAYAHESRTLIYHGTTRQCYFIFQRGYCHPGQWLTLNQRTGQAICQTNPCLKFAPPLLIDNYVQYNGRCVELNSSCDDEEGKIVKFVPDLILPRCNISSVTSKAVGAPIQSCAPGSYLAYNGKCQPNFVW